MPELLLLSRYWATPFERYKTASDLLLRTFDLKSVRVLNRKSEFLSSCEPEGKNRNDVRVNFDRTSVSIVTFDIHAYIRVKSGQLFMNHIISIQDFTLLDMYITVRLDLSVIS